MQSKIIIHGKVEQKKDKDGKPEKRKFKIKKEKKHEIDIDIEIEEDGTYEVEKLSVDGLPTEIEGQTITWLNNFAIKKADHYINQRYFVTLPGVGNRRVVIVDNNSHGVPYFYTGPVDNDVIVLSDGDPGVGVTG